MVMVLGGNQSVEVRPMGPISEQELTWLQWQGMKASRKSGAKELLSMVVLVRARTSSKGLDRGSLARTWRR